MMDPKLIAISGSLKGTTFALAEAEISIGREASNSIHLNDPSVSRRHCLIKRQPADRAQDETHDAKENAQAEHAALTTGDDEQFAIVDLESYNGTFVNGIPVQEQALAHGDQIAIGDVLLLFLFHEVDAAQRPEVPPDEDDLITRSTVRLRREDALYLRPERVLAELPPTPRVLQDLNALLKISTTINSISDLTQLQRELLSLIVEEIRPNAKLYSW